MTTFPTETVHTYPGRSDTPDTRTEPFIRLRGFDAVVVRAGTALAQWGRHRAARRSAAGEGQLHRSRLQDAHDENRATAAAASHSMLLP
ncbi:hypothetical protein [Arthrobacter pigmenti]